MTNSTKRKERIFEILKGSADEVGTTEEGLMLPGLSEVNIQHLQDNTRSWTLILVAVIATSGLYMLIPEVSASSTALWTMVVIVSLTFLRVVQEIVTVKRRRKKNHDDILLALQDLQRTSNYLSDYIQRLDRRTSKYFHCVTNSKVTSYFILSQVSRRLTERVGEISALLTSFSSENLQKAYESLSGSLNFRDGFDRNSGALHTVPLARLDKTILALTAELDEAVSELEREIEVSGMPDIEITEEPEPELKLELE